MPHQPRRQQARSRRPPVAIGDWVWGGEIRTPHPVIRIDRRFLLLGVERIDGNWVTTRPLAWPNIAGVIPANPNTHHPDPDALETTLQRITAGHLDYRQRETLAGLLAATQTASAPLITAAVDALIHAMTAPPPEHDQPTEAPR